jgi:ATP-dependent helicase/nuclease subunit B
VIERYFLGWNRPLLPLAARFLAERYPPAGGVLDLRRISVVTPGGRAGRRLVELLLDEATARGARLIPPRIVNRGDLAELFYQPRGRPVRDFQLRRVWAGALRDAGVEVVEPLFGEVPAPGDVAGWDRVAHRIASLHREVAGGGHSFSDVADVCEVDPGLLYNDSARWRLLAEVEVRYRRQLHILGWADADLERITAARTGQLRAEGEVWLIGVVDLPSAVAAIVRGSDSMVGALIHAPPEEKDSFDPLGLVVPSAWRDRQLRIPDERVEVGDLPADQAAEVLDGIAALGEARTGEVVVAVADPALVPWVRERMETAELPVHYGGGRSVGQSRPFRLLEAIARWLETGEWEEYSSLIHHPDVSRWWMGPPESAGSFRSLSEIDRAFTEYLPARVAGFGRRGAMMADVASAPRVRALVGPLEALLKPLVHPRMNSLPEWPAKILELLVTLYQTADLDPRARATRELTHALKKIRETALELFRLPSALAPRCDAASAIRILLEEIRGDTIPEDADGARIELLGWLEAVADDAPHIVVAGVNEGALPGATHRDAFLPDQLRSRLGVPDDSSRYSRDAFLLLSLLRSRESVRLICGRRTAEGDPLRPSRLLLTDRDRSLARRVVTLTGEGIRLSRTPPIAAAAGDVSRFALPPEAVLSFEPPLVFSVTGIRTRLSHPYQFVLASVLGLQDADDSAREMDPPAFGSVVHEVIRRFTSSADRDSPEAERVAGHLDRILDEVVAERFVGTFSSVTLQIEQLRGLLRRFAVWQAARAADGWCIVVVEGSILDDTCADDACTDEGDDTPGRSLEAPFSVDGSRSGTGGFQTRPRDTVHDIGYGTPRKAEGPTGDEGLRGTVHDTGHGTRNDAGRMVDPSPCSAGDATGEPRNVEGELQVTLRGRIDRIDYHPESDLWAILDYKTGNHPRHPEKTHFRGDRWVDAQLPLYRYLAASMRRADGSPLLPPGVTPALGYIALSTRAPAVEELMASWTEEQLLEADEAVREAIRGLQSGTVEFSGLTKAPSRFDPFGPLLGGRLLSAVGDDGETGGDETPEDDE